MTFSLTILGSSSALPTVKRFPTAHLLNVNERFFLIDCGEGTQIQLRKFKLSFAKINQVFISHMHGDHVFGLPGLLSTMQLLGRKKPLDIFGPDRLGSYLDQYRSFFGKEQDFEIRFNPVGHRGKKLIFENKNLEVFSIPLKHRSPTTGFLFVEKSPELNLKIDSLRKYRPSIEQIAKIKKGEDLIQPDGNLIPNRELTMPPYKKRSYAFISDTAFNRKIPPLIPDVKLLYHESTFAEKDKSLAKQTLHSTAGQAATIAREAGAERLILGHFSSRYKDPKILLNEAKEIFSNTILAEDGDTIVIEREREG